MKTQRRYLTYTDEKDVYAVYTNTDLTEGRGSEYPMLFCIAESTARRLGKKAYIMGSDCPVRMEKLYFFDDKWYGPIQGIEYPTKDDEAQEKVLQAQKAKDKAKKDAIAKAAKLGLSPEDIKALQQ